MKFDNYLTNINRKHRVLISKLRISDHKLEIEQGRRTTPTTPRENRLCKFCDTTIENEQHFITECKLYSRTPFFNDITNLYPEFTRLNNNQKFIYLMSQENPEITTNLAKKLQEWFSLRDFILKLTFSSPKNNNTNNGNFNNKILTITIATSKKPWSAQNCNSISTLPLVNLLVLWIPSTSKFLSPLVYIPFWSCQRHDFDAPGKALYIHLQCWYPLALCFLCIYGSKKDKL